MARLLLAPGETAWVEEPGYYGAQAAFVASGIGGFIANTAVLLLARLWVPIPVAKLFAIAGSFAVNFCLSHFVVFRSRAEAKRSTE